MPAYQAFPNGIYIYIYMCIYIYGCSNSFSGTVVGMEYGHAEMHTLSPIMKYSIFAIQFAKLISFDIFN